MKMLAHEKQTFRPGAGAFQRLLLQGLGWLASEQSLPFLPSFSSYAFCCGFHWEKDGG